MNVYFFVSQCTVKSPFTSFFASSRLFLYPISHVLQIGLFHAKTSHDFLALGSFEVWQIFCSTESLLENKQSTRVACDTHQTGWSVSECVAWSPTPIPRIYQTALNLLVIGKVRFFLCFLFFQRIASYCYVTAPIPVYLFRGLTEQL